MIYCMGVRRNFCRGRGRALKRPPQDKKGSPPKKNNNNKFVANCAITVFRGLGGTLPRENFNNGAPYDIFRCISAEAYLGFHFRGGGVKLILESGVYLHGAIRHAALGKATCLLRGIGGMLPREFF